MIKRSRKESYLPNEGNWQTVRQRMLLKSGIRHDLILKLYLCQNEKYGTQGFINVCKFGLIFGDQEHVGVCFILN